MPYDIHEPRTLSRHSTHAPCGDAHAAPSQENSYNLHYVLAHTYDALAHIHVPPAYACMMQVIRWSMGTHA